ncbi:hypothetical protein [Corallococcus terminator]|uniref:hypothetical protein n=1 Tax=Corallococcus terminator TaxID=2316733 RepID=UPI001FC997B3|nr:hypothetical protein [Corallococcus terminator]
MSTRRAPADFSQLDKSSESMWSREAARYAVIFGLLLEAEGSRVGIEEAGQREAHEGLPVRTVYLRGPVAVPAVSSETGFAWRGEAERFGRAHGQVAVLVGRTGGPAELLLCGNEAPPSAP